MLVRLHRRSCEAVSRSTKSGSTSPAVPSMRTAARETSSVSPRLTITTGSPRCPASGCSWQAEQSQLVFPTQCGCHLTEMAFGERGYGDAGEKTAVTPRDQTFSREKGEACRDGEGAAALCGDGKTHQVCDRSRTDGRSPELPDVRVVGWEPGWCPVPGDGSNLRSSGDCRAIGGTNGDARRWRDVPGTGGRTSTVSRNSSGRHRD